MRMKIVKLRDKCKDPFTNQPITMRLVKVFNEPTVVGKLHFHNDHLYNMKINDPKHKLYLYLNHPDYNDNSDFNKYRKLCGLMLPIQVKDLRKKYHLSTRELGAVLGISHATISNVENNNQVQSVALDTILRSLQNPSVMSRLIDDHLRLFKFNKSGKINIKELMEKGNSISKI